MRSKSQWADVVLGAQFHIGQRVIDRINKNKGVGVIVEMQLGDDIQVERSVYRPQATDPLMWHTNIVYLVDFDGDRSFYIEEDKRLETE